MEQKRRGDRGGEVGNLYDSHLNHCGQRSAVQRHSEQHGRDRDQQQCAAYGESGYRVTANHDATDESDGDSGTDGKLSDVGYRDGAIQLPVDEEWGGDQRGDVGVLYDASGNCGGQWSAVQRYGEQYGGERDQQQREPDGEHAGDGTVDHGPAIEPNDRGRTDGQLFDSGERNGTAELSMDEEWSGDWGGHLIELYDAGEHDGGQWAAIYRRGEQCGGKHGQQRGDPECECGVDVPDQLSDGVDEYAGSDAGDGVHGEL